MVDGFFIVSLQKDIFRYRIQLMGQRIMKRCNSLTRVWLSVFAFVFLGMSAFAQTAYPTIAYTVTETVNNEISTTDVEMNPGDDQVANAPLTIKMFANLDENVGWESKCEWKIYDPKDGESKPLLNRFEENTTYTLEKAGAYNIKFYVTFSKADEEDFEYESDVFKITITESQLSCPDGFSPNGDGKNDVFYVKHQSIVKMRGVIANRWGQKVYSFDLSNVDKGWDGRQNNGSIVKDGVYFLSLQAEGSDGVKYNIRKAVNVLKGFREYDE